MPETQPAASQARPPSLRALVLAATGQDARRCGRCSKCADYHRSREDLSLEMVLQLVLQNDDEVLTSRTVWSDQALEAARHDCISTLDVAAILLELRTEARRRGLELPAMNSEGEP